MKRPYAPLTDQEKVAVQSRIDGYGFIDAYRNAFPISRRWNEGTVKVKARNFFCSKRMQHYMDIATGLVAEELPEKLTKEQAMAEARRSFNAPTDYYAALPKQLIAYFDIPPFENVEYKNEKTGKVEFATKLNPLPTKAGFAASVKIPRSLLLAWATKIDADGYLAHPEFAAAYELVGDMQESLLVTNTLMGEYQPSFAIFTAKNLLGWKDSKDLNIASTGKPQELITEEMTAEQAALIYKDSLGQD
jgi:hypothetical protein